MSANEAHAVDAPIGEWAPGEDPGPPRHDYFQTACGDNGMRLSSRHSQ